MGNFHHSSAIRSHFIRNLAAITSAVAASVLFMAPAAFAEDAQPGSGEQSGTGATTLKLVLSSSDETSESSENLSFTVPSAINYVLKADGTLLAPSSQAAYIENGSVFPIEVSSMQARATSPWQLVTDVSSAEGSNLVQMSMGPSGNLHDLASFTTKGDVTGLGWTMDAANDSVTDRVGIASSGRAAHVSEDASSAKEFAVVTWYVRPAAYGKQSLTALGGQTLNAPAFSGALPKYMRFTSWNTSEDGSGTDVEVGDDFTPETDTVLYPKYADAVYNVQFSLSSTPTSYPMINNQTDLSGLHAWDTIEAQDPIYTAYLFLGWYTHINHNGLRLESGQTTVADLVDYLGDHDTFTLHSGVIAMRYKIIFDPQGGHLSSGTMESETSVYNNNARPIAGSRMETVTRNFRSFMNRKTLVKDGYTFGGWYTRPNGQGIQVELDSDTPFATYLDIGEGQEEYRQLYNAAIENGASTSNLYVEKRLYAYWIPE